MHSNIVEIDVKRCLCIHSSSQLVDIVLQTLLYQRQFIPEPVTSLLRSGSNAAKQFRKAYEQLARILQSAFRTLNVGRIREFVILIGGTPYSPKEIYRIPLPICQRVHDKAKNRDNDEEDARHNNKECRQCEQLSAKERRLVFTAVTLSKTAMSHFESCTIPGKTEKVFMFIRTRGQLKTNVEGLEEDEGFELPDDETQRRRKTRLLRIEVNPHCSGRGISPSSNNNNDEGVKKLHRYNVEGRLEATDEEEADENVLSLWYRLGPFFANLH